MNSELPKTILLIDNDPAVLLALETRLTSIGHRCVTAASGSQGLAEFSRGRVDLVISDVNMPQGDGIALAEAIRRISAVPILFITGFRDEYRHRMRHIADVVILRKPFATEVLTDIVDAQLGARGDSSMAA